MKLNAINAKLDRILANQASPYAYPSSSQRSYAQIAANALPPKIQPLSGPSPPPEQVTVVLRPYKDSILKGNGATGAEITVQVKKMLQTGVALAIPL